MADNTIQVRLNFDANTGAAKKAISDLESSLDNLYKTQKTSGFQDFGINEAVKSARELESCLNRALNPKTGKLDISMFQRSISEAGTSLNDFNAKLLRAGPAGQQVFASLAGAIAQAEVPLKRANRMVTEFTRSLKNVAQYQISSSMFQAVTGAISDAISYTKDLNSSLNDIRIVTGQSAEQMAQFAQQANKSAQLLSTTTNNYAKASLIFYQQGLGAADVKERTDAVIKMANVTKDSMTEVSSYMTAIWNNFDDGSKSLEHYADVMTALGATTASSTAEIAAGLEKFASIGKTIGLSYDYATSALATIVSQTRQSADTVGTGLRTIFSRLQGLSLGETLEDGVDLNKYSKALNTVGVQILDASGNMKNMDTILESLADKWSNLSQAQKTALAQTVGGVRQYTTLISLMDNWDSMEKNLTTVKNSSGSLQKQQDIYAESWEAAASRSKAAMEELYNTLLNDKAFITLTDGLTSVTNAVTSLVNAMGGLPGLLSTIGMISMRVFSKQIGSGINNTVQKFTTWKSQFNGQGFGKAAIQTIRGKSKSAAQVEADQSLQAAQYSNQVQMSRLRHAGKEGSAAYLAAQQSSMLLDKKRRMMTTDLTEEQAIAAREKISKISEAQQRRLLLQQEKEETQKQRKSTDSDERLGAVFVSQDNTYRVGKKKGQTRSTEDQARHIFQKTGLGNLAAQEFGVTDGNNLTQEQRLKYLSQLKARARKSARDQGLAETYKDVVLDGQSSDDDRKSMISRMQKAFGKNVIADTATIDDINKKLEEISQNAQKAETEINDVINAAKGKDAEVGKALEDMVSEARSQGEEDLSLDAETIEEDLNLEEMEESFDKIFGDKGGIGAKISAGLESGVAAIGGVTAGFNQASAAAEVLYDATASVGDKIGSIASMASGLATAFATGGPLGAIAYGVGIAASFAYDAIDNAYHKEELDAEDAETAVSKLQENYQNIKAEYDEMISTVDSYDSAVDTLDSLVIGTDAWKESLIAANEAALELIDNFDLIQDQDYTIDSNGKISFTQIGQQKIEDKKTEQLNKMIVAQSAASLAQAEAAKMRAEADKDIAVKSNDKGRWATAAGMGTAGAATGAKIGAAGGIKGILAGGLIGGAGGFLGGLIAYDSIMKTQNDAEKAKIDSITEKYRKNRSNTELEQLINSEFEGATQSYKNSVMNVVKATIEAETSFADAMELAAKASLNANATYENIKNEEVKDNIAARATQAYTEAKTKADADYDSAIEADANQAKVYADEYLKSLNLKGAKLEGDRNSDGSFTYSYLNENNERVKAEMLGAEIKTYTTTKIADAVINDNVDNWNQVFSALERGDNKDRALAALGSGDLLKATKQERDALTMTDGDNLTAEQLKAFGLEGKGKGEIRAWIKNALNEYDTAWADAEANIKDHFSSGIVGNMTAETAKAFSNFIDELNKGPMAEAGDIFGDTLSTAFTNLKIDDKDQTTLLAKISNIDWTQDGAFDNFKQIFEDMGYSLDAAGVSWEDFEKTMSQATLAVPDFSSLKDTLQSVSSILNKLKLGETVSEDDYKTLTKYNSAWKDLFVLQADGSRKFIGDAKTMKEATLDLVEQEKTQLDTRKALADLVEDENFVFSTKSEQIQNTAEDFRTLINDPENSILKTFLSNRGYDDDELDTIINEAQNGNTERLQKIYQLINESIDPSQIQAATTEYEQMYASLATTTSELDALYNGGKGFSSETYSKSLIAMASNYEYCSTAIKNYQEALKNGANSPEAKAAEEQLKNQIDLEQKAAKVETSLKNSMSDRSKLSMEDLQTLKENNTELYNSLLTASDQDWYEISYQAYSEFLQARIDLLDQDTAEYKKAILEKQQLDEEYYQYQQENTQKQIDNEYEKIEEKYNNLISSIESATSILNNINLDIGLDSLGASSLEKLRQELRAVYGEAVDVDAIIRNIGKQEEGSKEMAIAIADAKMMLQLKKQQAETDKLNNLNGMATVEIVAERSRIDPPYTVEENKLTANTKEAEITIRSARDPKDTFITDEGGLNEIPPEDATYNIISDKNGVDTTVVDTSGDAPKLYDIGSEIGTYTIKDEDSCTWMDTSENTISLPGLTGDSPEGTYVIKDNDDNLFYVTKSGNSVTVKSLTPNPNTTGSYKITATLDGDGKSYIITGQDGVEIAKVKQTDKKVGNYTVGVTATGDICLLDLSGKEPKLVDLGSISISAEADGTTVIPTAGGFRANVDLTPMTQIIKLEYQENDRIRVQDDLLKYIKNTSTIQLSDTNNPLRYGSEKLQNLLIEKALTYAKNEYKSNYFSMLEDSPEGRDYHEAGVQGLIDESVKTLDDTVVDLYNLRTGAITEKNINLKNTDSQISTLDYYKEMEELYQGYLAWQKKFMEDHGEEFNGNFEGDYESWNDEQEDNPYYQDFETYVRQQGNETLVNDWALYGGILDKYIPAYISSMVYNGQTPMDYLAQNLLAGAGYNISSSSDIDQALVQLLSTLLRQEDDTINQEMIEKQVQSLILNNDNTYSGMDLLLSLLETSAMTNAYNDIDEFYKLIDSSTLKEYTNNRTGQKYTTLDNATSLLDNLLFKLSAGDEVTALPTIDLLFQSIGKAMKDSNEENRTYNKDNILSIISEIQNNELLGPEEKNTLFAHAFAGEFRAKGKGLYDILVDMGLNPDEYSEGAKELGKIFTENIFSGEENAVNKDLIEVLKDLGTNAEEYSDEAINIGRMIVQGIIAGMGNDQASLQAFAKSLGFETLDALRSAFQIKSPSRATMQMGMYLVEGLQKGLDSTQLDTSTFAGNILSSLAEVTKKIKADQVWDNLIKSITPDVDTWLASFTEEEQAEKRALLESKYGEGFETDGLWENEEFKKKVAEGEKETIVTDQILRTMKADNNQYHYKIVASKDGKGYNIQSIREDNAQVNENLYQTEEAAAQVILAMNKAEEAAISFFGGDYLTSTAWNPTQLKYMSQIIDEITGNLSVEDYINTNGLQKFYEELNRVYGEYKLGMENSISLGWAEIEDQWRSSLKTCQELDDKAATDTYNRWKTVWEGISALRVAAFEDSEKTVAEILSKNARDELISRAYNQNKTDLTFDSLVKNMFKSAKNLEDTDEYLTLPSYLNSGLTTSSAYMGFRPNNYGFVEQIPTLHDFKNAYEKDLLRSLKYLETTSNVLATANEYGEFYELSRNENGDLLTDEEFLTAYAKTLGLNNGSQLSEEQKMTANTMRQVAEALSSSGVLKETNGEWKIDKGDSSDFTGSAEEMKDIILAGMNDAKYQALIDKNMPVIMSNQIDYLASTATQYASDQDAKLKALQTQQDLIDRKRKGEFLTSKEEAEVSALIQKYGSLDGASESLATEMDNCAGAVARFIQALANGYVPTGSNGQMVKMSDIKQGDREENKPYATREAAEKAAGKDLNTFVSNGQGGYTYKVVDYDETSKQYYLRTDVVSADDVINVATATGIISGTSTEWENNGDQYWTTEMSRQAQAAGFANKQEQDAYIKAMVAEGNDTDYSDGGMLDTAEIIAAHKNAGIELTDEEALKIQQEYANQLALMEEGLSELAKSGKDWLKILNKENKSLKEQSKILPQLRTNYQKILGLTDEQIAKMPDDFFLNPDNLKLATTAAEKAGKKGQEALDKLQVAAANAVTPFKDLEEMVGNTEKTFNELAIELSQLDLNAGDLLSGDGLASAEAYWDGVVNASIAGGQSVAEAVETANAAMANLGYDVEPGFEYVTESIPSTDLKTWYEQTGTESFDIINSDGSTTTVTGDNFEQMTQSLPTTVTVGYIKGKGASKGVGTGGTSNNYRKKAEKPGGGGSGGGGGGGGRDPRRANKINKKDNIERYHEINNVIDDLADAYKRLNTEEERAWGKNRINAMQQESKIIKEQIAAVEEKIRQAKEWKKQDLSAALSEGWTFDANGNVNNYDEFLSSQIDKYNAAIDSYNNMSADAQEDLDKKYQDMTNKDGEYYSSYEDYLKQTLIDDPKEALKQYEETMELLEDLGIEYDDFLNEWHDNIIGQIQTKLDTTLEVTKDQFDYLEHKLGRIKDDAYSAAEAIELMSQQMDITQAQFNAQKSALDDLLKAYSPEGTVWSAEDLMNGNISAEDLANAGMQSGDIELIQTIMEGLMDASEQMSEQMVNSIEHMANAFEEFNADMDRYISTVEHAQAITSTYRNIIDLTGRTMSGFNSTMLKSINDAIAAQSVAKLETNKTKYETIKTEYDEAKAAYEAAQASYAEGGIDAAALKAAKDTYQAAQDNMNEAQEAFLSSWEEALQAAADAFQSNMEAAVRDIGEMMSGGLAGGLAELEDAFAKMNEQDQNYVDDYEKIYQLTKMTRDLNDKIDSTSNVRAQKELLKYQKELNNLLESDQEMSSYDLDYLQKKLDLKLAEIALDEAQNAKSQVTMRRDSEGNYNYVYTADENAVAKAESDYADKLYEMQKANDEYITNLSENMANLSSQMLSEIAAIDTTIYDTEEKYQAEVQRITDHYTTQMEYYNSEMNKVLDNNKTLYEQDWTNFNKYTGYKISAEENYVTRWNQTVLSQVTGFETQEEFYENFNKAVFGEDPAHPSGESLIGRLVTAYKSMRDQITAANAAAGVETEDLATALLGNIEAATQEAEAAADGITDAATEIVSQITSIGDAVTDMVNNYSQAMATMEAETDAMLGVLLDFLTAYGEIGDLNVEPGVLAEIEARRRERQENPEGFDTGGYTGAWGSEGRLAYLHQKELVLNAEDTVNILTSVGILRQIASIIDLNALASAGGFISLMSSGVGGNQGTLQQEVHIEASFPAVTDKNQIEEAFGDLVNLAAQYANRRV